MPDPGIYLTNASGETTPLAVEGEDADVVTLAEAVDEELTPSEQADLIAHLSGPSTST